MKVTWLLKKRHAGYRKHIQILYENHQNDIGDFNVNVKHIFVYCGNFESRHAE